MKNKKQEYKEGDIIEEGPFAGFELISKYTRSQAISDGVLIDVSTFAKSLGITLPVAITAALWGVVEPDSMAEEAGETAASRLGDVLQMLIVGIRGMTHDDGILFYDVLLTSHGNPRVVTVKGVCGPGDSEEPVITLMLPDED